MTDRVLPGNPGSDWTEQDERELKSDANIPDVYAEGVSGEFRRSQLARLRSYAREILRLRAELALKPTHRFSSREDSYAVRVEWPGGHDECSAPSLAEAIAGNLRLQNALRSPSGAGSATTMTFVCNYCGHRPSIDVRLGELCTKCGGIGGFTLRSPEVEEAGEAK
jgi:hypothetical protein